MTDELAKELIGRYDFLKKQRESWVDEWMDIRNFVLPHTGFFEEDGDKANDGASRYDFIMDATATRSMRVLAAGMQGGLTSPARPWFRLSLYDDQLAQHRPVQEWLNTVERIMYGRFARSNFYNMVHKVYGDEAGYGTAVMICDTTPKNLLNFSTLSPGEYCLSEGADGTVDTVHRIVWMTLKQLANKFGMEKLPEEITRMMNPEKKYDPYEYRKILHVIEYRDIYDPDRKDRKNKPVRSTYVDYDLGKVLDDGGYEEWPCACPRWITSGADVYGRSPGHDVLPDVKMLQEQQADKLNALAKLIDPPLKAGGGLKSEVSHMAGGVTFMDNATQAERLEAIYQVQPDLNGMMAAIEDTRTQIREGLYNDLFLMLINARPNMTATEVTERHEEKLLILGPVIERQFFELLNPIIDRTFFILNREGKLPPIPEVLLQEAKKMGDDAVDIKVEYVSLLAQAQKIMTTRSIDAVTSYAMNVAAIKGPEALDKIDIDEAIDQYAQATGAPPSIVFSDDLVSKKREAKAQELAKAQEMQKAQQQAGTLKTISEVNTDEGSPLNQLQSSMTEGVV